MNRQWLITGLALLVAAPPPTPVLAQDAPRARTRVSPRADVRAYSLFGERGRIGVIVNTEANAETDRLGARLEGITPGGPAEKAGLRVGDIVTKFNNTALGGVRADDADESGPGNKLVELAHELEPGDTVRLEYRRGNETKTVTLVAEDLGFRGVYVAPKIMVPPMRFEMPEIAMGDFAFAFGGLRGAWGGVELIALESDLGEYFGVREGLLVVKVRGDTTLPLRAGDVILSFDGRKPTSPSHAMRILRSYEAGEQVKLEIMRKQRPTTVTWTVPETEGRWRTPRPARAPRPERGEES